MNAKIAWGQLIRIIALTGLLFGLSIIDFTSFSVQPLNPGMLLLVCLLQVVVMSMATIRAQHHGWRLLVGLFLSFYGVNTIMVAIEAVYLPETLPLEIVIPLLVNGGIRAFVYVLIALPVWQVLVSSQEPDTPHQTDQHWSWLKWVGKFALVGLCWAVLFVMGGALVFLPLARRLDPVALASYTNLAMPDWVLPFQIVRGIMWALLTLPLIRLLRGSRWQKAMIISLLYAVIMGSNLLLANSIPNGIRIAHLTEVLFENFLFGILVTVILSPRMMSSLANKEERYE